MCDSAPKLRRKSFWADVLGEAKDIRLSFASGLALSFGLIFHTKSGSAVLALWAGFRDEQTPTATPGQRYWEPRLELPAGEF